MMTRTIRKFIIQSAAIAISAVTVNAATAAEPVVWGYKGNIGPERWGQLSKDFALCSKGKVQSPIDIIHNPPQKDAALTINYQTAPMVIVDDGTTDLMIGNTQTIINDGHGIQLNFPADTKETINYDGTDYQLVQFHIHTPSENKLHGESFPMEIHFVHQGEGGKVAVIGVFAKMGEENPALEKIVNHLPKEQGKPQVIEGETINPTDLLPAKRDYYSFAGSLTTPPCVEGIQWIVMDTPINISSAQVLKLRKAVDGPNARPVQKLNKREISFSVAK